MSYELRIGDHVKHYSYGNGVILHLYTNGVTAEVKFSNTTKYVDSKSLVSERVEKAKRELTIREKQKTERERKEREKHKKDEKHKKLEIERERKRQEEERLRVEETRTARKKALIAKIEDVFESDFLNVDVVLSADLDAEMINEDELNALKSRFVRNWADREIKKQWLDSEQAAAVAAIGSDIQVIARAGSGKTRTLVSRAIFLQKHCGVSPDEMLLLAFNNKPAKDMEKHLGAKITGRIPHVMTFHALARALTFTSARSEGRIAPDLLKDDEYDKTKSRVIQRLIDDHLRIPAFEARIRKLMLAHFRKDWDRIIEGGYHKSKEELLKFRRSLPHQSLRGEYVKSFGEKAIADFLFEHDIPYVYERNEWLGGVNYRPDFTIFKTKESGVIIEYFGLKGEQNYDEMSKIKRDYWKKKPEWVLVELTPQNISIGGVDNFREHLKSSLGKQGVSYKQLSEDEIWQRIQHRRPIDEFTKAIGTFIGRCRKCWFTQDKLDELIAGHTTTLSDIEDIDVEAMFLSVGSTLYKAYLDRLNAAGEEDFDGLLQQATSNISRGKIVFERKSGCGDINKLRYVFIDEFQDFSELFYRLISAMRKENPRLAFFCVGDDWQAINGFAGSDLRFFQNFGHYFDRFRKLDITTNYRSSQSIVNVSNELMSGIGKPAVAHDKAVGYVLMADLSKFKPSFLEEKRHSGDIITPVVLRLTSKALYDDLDVVLLSRRNSLPWYVNYRGRTHDASRSLDPFLNSVRSFFPKGLQERITISTAHKYKGLEKSMVIVLDAVARCYPLIHPNWVFSRIFGENLQAIIDEERRLFYVAITRAEKKLVIITEWGQASPFCEDIQRKKKIQQINWDDYPPVRVVTNRLLIKVRNQEYRGSNPTFSIKGVLKSAGYRYSDGWAKDFAAEDFTIEVLKREIWAESADGIEVQIFDDSEFLTAKYFVDSGKWRCVFDKQNER